MCYVGAAPPERIFGLNHAEVAMQAKTITTAGSLAVALALSIGTAFADTGAANAPIQVAALSTVGIAAAPADEAFPPLEAGVRAAARSGPEALRRYVWRTRMIHNFYYNDFARLFPGAG